MKFFKEIIISFLSLFGSNINAQITYVEYDGSFNYPGTSPEPLTLISTSPGIIATSPDAITFAACHNYSACDQDQFALSYSSAGALSATPPPATSWTHSCVYFNLTNATGADIPVDEIEFFIQRYDDAGTPTNVQVSYSNDGAPWVSQTFSILSTTASCVYSGSSSIKWTLPSTENLVDFGSFQVKLQLYGGSFWCNHYEVLIDKAFVRGNIPLPAEVISFSGEKINAFANVLNWKTVSEEYAKNFTVERSTDGENFFSIGSVPASLLSTESKEYQFMDSQLPVAPNIYYRLKIADIFGNERKTNIIEIQNPENFQLELFPNPALEFLNIRISSGSRASLYIYDALGILVKKKEFLSETKIEVFDLPSGRYFVKTVADGCYATKTFVKY